MVITNSRIKFLAFLFFVPLLFASFLQAQEQTSQTKESANSFNLKAEDRVNDDGKRIDLTWKIPENIPLVDIDKIELYRKAPDEKEAIKLSDLTPDVDKFEDVPPEAPEKKKTDTSETWQKKVDKYKADLKLAPQNDVLYSYYLKLVQKDGSEIISENAQGKAIIQWFNKKRTVTLIVSILSIAFVLYCIYKARTDTNFFIRRMVVIDAIEDGVGRATEMGKPILFVSGLSTIDDIATIAAINILGSVARKCAEYGSRIIVPNKDAIVMTVQQEVVKEAYVSSGKPDAYKEEDVFFVTTDQMGYVAAVDGIMVRDKPATNLFLGTFYAESLILAETGASTGAIQIAGTDAITQLPFFITSCDYTLIGEELYAASAYISREPMLLGSLKGQDYLKFIFMIAIFLGAILASCGITIIKDLFTL
jgi:hypothetical protein